MRLIVLSKTHARGPSRRTTGFDNLSPDDVFSRSTLQALETPGRPFLHDVNATGREPGREPVAFLDRGTRFKRGVVVEPDGIEPTTSCLQSTRSTN